MSRFFPALAAAIALSACNRASPAPATHEASSSAPLVSAAPVVSSASPVSSAPGARTGSAPASEALAHEECAALAHERTTAAPEAALVAALRLAAAHCGAERERALVDIEARVRKGPLPGIPAPGISRLSSLCAIELSPTEQARSIQTLRAIALSARQPLPVRTEAMSAVRSCIGGDWPSLRAMLSADHDPKVRAEAVSVDRIIIDW